MDQKAIIAIVIAAVVVVGGGVGIAIALSNGGDSEASYTVKFNVNGGNAIDDKSFTKNTETFSLPDAARDGGYTFIGWYGNADFTGDMITQVEKGTEKDIEVWAKWQLNITTKPSANQIKDNTNVNITYADGTSAIDMTIEQAAISEIKAGKEVTVVQNDTVSGKPISWTFTGADDVSADYKAAPQDVSTKVTPDRSELASNRIVTLDFEYDGALPYPSTIRYYIGTDVLQAGTLVSVKNENDPEPIGQYPVGNDGYIEFTITHCSDWYLQQWITITYDADGGAFNDGATTKQVSGVYGSAVTVPTPNPERTGYTFAGWEENIASFTVTKTVRANWTANTYTVVYSKNANDATGSVDDQPLQYGNQAALSSGAGLARTGYSLSGWNTAADGSGTAYPLSGNVSNLTAENNGTVNLYAQWAPITYTIAFDGNGSTSGSVASVNASYGVVIIIPPNGFTKTGNAFAGWNTAADGSGTPYLSGAEVSNLTAENGAIVTMYAQWDPVTYKLHFNKASELASGTMVDQIVTYGTLPAINECDFTSESQAFGGWATSEGGDVVYADEARLTSDLADTQDAVVNLYAVWEDFYIQMNIFYDGQPDPEVYENVRAVRNQIFYPMARIGTGVYKVSSTQQAPIVNDGYDIYIGDMQVAGIDVSGGRAVFDLDYFTVSFNTGCEIQIQPQKVIINGYVQEPQNIDRTGYNLTGWNNGNIDWNFYTQVTEITTLTAQWAPITYTIAYSNNGGSGTLPAANATYGVAIPASRTGEAITNDGYTFVNWNTAADGSGTSFAPGDNLLNLTTVQGATVTLYAQWAPVTYYVIYNPNGGTGEIPQMTMTYGVAAQLAAGSFTRDGYSFVNWNTQANGSGASYSALQSVQNLATEQGATVTMFAQWTPVQYTATFHSNGGDSVDPITFTVVSDDTPLPNTLRSGYAFQGWFDNAQLTGNAYAVIASGTIGDKDFYAKWGSNNATVQTKLNGVLYSFPEAITLWNNTNSATMTVRGTGDYYLESSDNFPITNGDTLTVKRGDAEIGTMTISDGIGALTVNYYRVYFKIDNDVYEEQAVRSGDVPVRPDDPTLPGRTFSKWTNTDKSDFDFTKAITSSIAAYAKFTANPYTVTLADDRGTIGTLNVHYGDDIEAMQVPLRDGFNFEGYFLENDQYFDASGNPMPNKVAWMMTDNITLTAHWGAMSITLDFRNEGPSLTATYGQAMPALSNAYMPNPDTGYEFIGYFDAAEGGKKYYNADLSSAVQTCDLVQNTVMYAQYAKITYTLVYVLNGGTGTVPVGTQVQIGDVVERPASDPTKSGYTFNAWSLTDGVETTYFDQGTHTVGAADIILSENGNLRVFAIWTGNQYTVQYDANGGTGDVPQASRVRAGATFVLPEFSTTKTVGNDRFFFAGWNTAEDGTGDVYRGSQEFNDAFIALANNENVVTLYVNWASMEFTPAVGYTFVGKQINGPNEQYDRTMIVIAVSAMSYRVEEDTGFELQTYEFPIGSYPVMEYWCTYELIDTVIAEQNRTGTDTVTINGVQKTVDVYTARGTIGSDPYIITMKVTADGFVCVMTTEGVSSGAVTTYQYLTHEQRNYQPVKVTYNPYGGTPSGEQVRSDGTYQSAEQLGISRAGYRFLGWDNNFATFKPGDLVTKSRSVYASWEQITNPRTNISWTVYNQPEGITFLIGENDAYRQNGVEGQFVTVSGGSDWSYSQNVFTFVLDGVTYHATVTDGDADHITVLNDNGRFKIRFDEPGEDQYTSAYEIDISFCTDLPARGQYVPTVDDTFVYNDGEADMTYRVTNVRANQYTFVNAYGSSMGRMSGLYPQDYNQFYPDGDEYKFTWTNGTVVFNQQTIDCYVMTCRQFVQYYVSSYSQKMTDYNVYTFYIGVADGLCYKAIFGYDSLDYQGHSSIEYTTYTLNYKPPNMNYIATYHVTMQFNGGTYNGQQSAVRDLTGPSTTIIPQRDGFDFAGWSLTQGGDVRYAYIEGAFNPGNFLPADATEGAITVYAVWQDIPAQQYDLICSGLSNYYTTFTDDAEYVTMPTLQQMGLQSGPLYELSIQDSSRNYHYFGPGDQVSMELALDCVYNENLVVYVGYATARMIINANYEGADPSSYNAGNAALGEGWRSPEFNDLPEWTNEGYIAIGYSTSSQGGQVYDFGSRIPLDVLIQARSAGDVNLFVVWSDDYVTGHLRGNFEGADPEEMTHIVAQGMQMELPSMNDITHMWTNPGYVPVSFNTQADGSGESFAFEQSISYDVVAEIPDNTIYVIWGTLTQCRIYGNFDGADPVYYTINIVEDDDTQLPTFNDIFSRYDRNEQFIPVAFGSLPDMEDYDNEFFDLGSLMDADGFSHVNGCLYVMWMDIESVSGVIVANVDCSGDSVFIPLQTLNGEIYYNAGSIGQGIPDADTVAEYWDYLMLTPGRINTSPDGEGTDVTMGQAMTEEQFNALGTKILYVIWEEPDDIIGYIYGNFEGATPERIEGNFDPTEDEHELPGEAEITYIWSNPGYHPIYLNSQADGEGDLSLDFGDTITIEQIRSLMEDEDNPCLYVIWELDD